ncbi:MAG: hypothetical protein DWQ06_05245 [Calditrichaeota bacterium]|nr:MAG: hypothetical protein DWQ06_05245 [Calditrichota bacterium]
MPNLVKEIEILTELIKANPSSLLLGRLADNYLKMELFEEAKFNCSLLLSKEPENISTRIVLVNALIKTRNYEEALKELEELKKIAPTLAMTFELEAIIYKKTANNSLALEAFRNALQKDRFNQKYAREIKNFEVAAGLDSLIEDKSSAFQESSNVATKEILEKPIGEIEKVEDAQDAQTKILARLKNIGRKQEEPLTPPEIFEEEIISVDDELPPLDKVGKEPLEATETDVYELSETFEEDELSIDDDELPPLEKLVEESLETTETDVYELPEAFEEDEFSVDDDELPPLEEEKQEVVSDSDKVEEAKLLQAKRLERLKAISEAKETQNSEKLEELSEEESEEDLEDSSELPPLDSKVTDEIPDENFGLGNPEDFKSVLGEALQEEETEEYSEDFINFEEESVEELFEPKISGEEPKKIEPKKTKPSLDSKGQINSLYLVKIYAEQELYDKAISILKSRKNSEKTSKYDQEIKKYEKLWKELQEAEGKKKK